MLWGKRKQFVDSAVRLMRTLTNSNAILIDGTSDTPQHIAIWKDYASEAHDIAKDLYHKVGVKAINPF